jgi:hypothetical protein
MKDVAGRDVHCREAIDHKSTDRVEVFRGEDLVASASLSRVGDRPCLVQASPPKGVDSRLDIGLPRCPRVTRCRLLVYLSWPRPQEPSHGLGRGNAIVTAISINEHVVFSVGEVCWLGDVHLPKVLGLHP